jgi:hypothetical protein
MSDDEPTVPVRCPECGSESRVPVSELAEAVDRHNENLHDGDEVARVDPAVRDVLADMVAEDLGLL